MVSTLFLRSREIRQMRLVRMRDSTYSELRKSLRGHGFLARDGLTVDRWFQSVHHKATRAEFLGQNCECY